MSQHGLIRKIERVGGTALMYEGAVLALRRIPKAPKVPAISDLVWLFRNRAARCAVAAGVCSYLFWHLVFGGEA